MLVRYPGHLTLRKKRTANSIKSWFKLTYCADATDKTNQTADQPTS